MHHRVLLSLVIIIEASQSISHIIRNHDNYPSIPGTTDCVDGHGMLELREILGRQLDVTCLTVFEGAPGISVYKLCQNCSGTVRNKDLRAAWDGYNLRPQRCHPCNAQLRCGNTLLGGDCLECRDEGQVMFEVLEGRSVHKIARSEYYGSRLFGTD